jgi:hypothetical protein
LEQLKKTNSRERAKTRESFGFLSECFGVDPRRSAASAMIRGNSSLFQAGSGASGWNYFERGFTRMAADRRGSIE